MSGNKAYRQALPPGYTLAPARKHMRVIGPNGEPVRLADGRVLVIGKGGKPNSKSEQSLLRLLKELP